MQKYFTADVSSVRFAEDAHGQLGASGAHQSGNTDDLATLHMQVHALDDNALGVHLVVHLPVFHLEHFTANVGPALRVAVGHFAAHHVADHGVFADLA